MHLRKAGEMDGQNLMIETKVFRLVQIIYQILKLNRFFLTCKQGLFFNFHQLA